MDFRLATTLGILLVLAVGVMWFERSRPSSRVIALVASLTALAVASRLVLAPIPNVVGTTDVALLTGYALGGPPGFMVGALAAPISNIWLGQGPWTVWQMAGWGLAGLAGAGLAMVAGRHLGRSRPRARVRSHGPPLRRSPRPLGHGDLWRRAVARPLPGSVGARHPLQHRARGRQLRDRVRGRPGAGADDLPLPRAARVHLASRGRAAGRPGRARRRDGISGRARGARRRRQRPCVARARAERGRRVRRDARPALFGGDDHVGGARPGGGGRQPARRGARRATRRSTSCGTRGSRRRPTCSGRSSRSRAPGSTRARSRAAIWSRSFGRSARATARGRAR